uniref:OSJNBa0022F16.15 protein n=1 Tax=Oryza sativa subsp. japonica TaxID=39947 RepID=Q7XKY9_ORYSJ|nr:OSJNBa0022F16.15 [Oryza sativa Japonica Group]
MAMAARGSRWRRDGATATAMAMAARGSERATAMARGDGDGGAGLETATRRRVAGCRREAEEGAELGDLIEHLPRNEQC